MNRLLFLFVCILFTTNAFSQLVTEETKDEAYIAPTNLLLDKWWYGVEEESWQQPLSWNDGHFGRYDSSGDPYSSYGHVGVITDLYLNSNGTFKRIWHVKATIKYDNFGNDNRYTYYTVTLTGKWNRQKGTLTLDANKMSAKCNFTVLENVKKEDLSIRKKDLIKEVEKNIEKSINTNRYPFLEKRNIYRLDSEYLILEGFVDLVLMNQKQ